MLRLREHGEKLSRKLQPIFNFTFPDCQDVPAELFQGKHAALITFNVTVQLCKPKLGPRLGENRVAAILVPVPETSMHE